MEKPKTNKQTKTFQMCKIISSSSKSVNSTASVKLDILEEPGAYNGNPASFPRAWPRRSIREAMASKAN